MEQTLRRFCASPRIQAPAVGPDLWHSCCSLDTSVRHSTSDMCNSFISWSLYTELAPTHEPPSTSLYTVRREQQAQLTEFRYVSVYKKSNYTTGVQLASGHMASHVEVSLWMSPSLLWFSLPAQARSCQGQLTLTPARPQLC